MWLVGYLYNANGMGTWCWEAASALHEAGEPVTLVCSDDVPLPGSPPFAILRVAPPARTPTLAGKIAFELKRLSAHGPRVMAHAVDQLAARGIHATQVVINAPEFHDEEIRAPQLVVAWARGTSLPEYVDRLRVQLRRERGRRAVPAALGALGGWRRDWHGYRRADVVLAVTTPLRDELATAGVRVALLHPCTASFAEEPTIRDPSAVTRLLMAAADLDEERKQVGWMLDVLRLNPPHGCRLTLVGNATEALRDRALATGIPVEFAGVLPRDQAVRRMRDNDVLLFASALDDWGFVLTESMAQGLAVVAPRMAPFDEILGDTGASYEPGSAQEFGDAIRRVRASLNSTRRQSWERATSEFSRARFAAELRRIAADDGLMTS